MIKVIIKKDSAEINGHAMFDDYGNDIVCAAVSGIVITSINAIIRLDDRAIDYSLSRDSISIDILRHSRETDLLILNMTSLLKELEEKYKENIKVYEEV